MVKYVESLLIDVLLLYLMKIRDDVTQRSLIAKRQMELKDMIIEDEVPDIGYVLSIKLQR